MTAGSKAGVMFPRSTRRIAEGIEEALFEAFGVEQPAKPDKPDKPQEEGK